MKISRRQWLQGTAASVLGLKLGTHEGFAASEEGDAPGEFAVKPYLQLGRNPSSSSLQVHWQTPDAAADWAVEFGLAKTGPWKKAATPTVRRLTVQGTPPRR